MIKKIIRFVGEARIAFGKKVLEVELKNDDVKILDLLEMISKKTCIHDLKNEVEQGKYLVLLDGINIFYLNGLQTSIKRFSTITIVQAAAGG